MSLLILGIIALFVMLILTLFALLIYSGLFESVDVGTGPPPITQCLFAYTTRTGPYKGCGDLFTETTCLAPEKKCMGIYYDDPEVVAAENCRYAVGSIISEGTESPDIDLKKKFEKAGYKFLELPLVDYAVHATFPYRTTISIFIAVYRVYPAMRVYTEERQLSARPYMEMYEGNTIHFFSPLSKQDDFYIPEALDCIEANQSNDPQHEDPEPDKDRSRRSRSPTRECDTPELDADELPGEISDGSDSSFEVMDAPN